MMPVNVRSAVPGRLLLLVILVHLVAPGCTGTRIEFEREGEACLKDPDCPGGACVGGVCKFPDALPSTDAGADGGGLDGQSTGDVAALTDGQAALDAVEPSDGVASADVGTSVDGAAQPDTSGLDGASAGDASTDGAGQDAGPADAGCTDPSCEPTATVLGRTFYAVPKAMHGYVELAVYPAGGCAGADGSGALKSLTSNAKGEYSVALPPGSYCLLALHHGTASHTGDFTLKAGQTRMAHIFLHGEGFIARCGLVTDADTGAPVAGATVSIANGQADNRVTSTLTNAQGQYCLHAFGLLSAKDWWLRALAGGHALKSQPASEAQHAFVDLALEASTTSTCFEEGFESDSGWTASAASASLQWHRRQNGDKANTHIPACVDVSLDEECYPKPASPFDSCQICSATGEGGCIPKPGLLPRAPKGQWAAWFGDSSPSAAASYLGSGGSCAAQSGGISAVPLKGTFTSAAIAVPAATTDLSLRLWMWYEIESQLKKGVTRDSLDVQVSTDGVQFSSLGALHPDGDFAGEASAGYTSAGYAVAPIWALIELPLPAALQGQVAAAGKLYVRFSFETGDTQRNGFRGWLVDGLKVIGKGCK